MLSARTPRWEATALRLAAVAISFVATAMSVYYSYAWFAQSLPFIGASSMAFIMVACISLAPQFVIMLFSKKTASAIIAAIIISLVAIPAATFSMGTTVGGLYNKRSRTISESMLAKEHGDAAKAMRDRIDSKIERIKGDIASAKEEESIYWERYTALSNAALGSRAESLLKDRLDSARGRVETKEAELASVLQEKEESQANEVIKVVRDDFYTWIAARFNLPVDDAEFALLSFPAIFIDIVAPTMLAVALFL
jgi:hypothetical protein